MFDAQWSIVLIHLIQINHFSNDENEDKKQIAHSAGHCEKSKLSQMEFQRIVSFNREQINTVSFIVRKSATISSVDDEFRQVDRINYFRR